MFILNKIKCSSYSLLVLFLILLCCPDTVAQEITSKPIKVGVYNNHPKVFVNENGEPDGIFIDVISAIAENENLQIEYVIGEWDDLLKKLKTGEIDVMPDVAYSEGRDSIYTFNELSVLGSWLEVFTTKKGKISSILDLNNKKIGVLKGSIQERYLSQKLKKDFNLTFDLINFKNYSASVNALREKKIDAIVSGRFFYFSDDFNKDIFSTGIVFRPSELYFAFPKNQDPKLIQIFDANLSLLKNNATSKYYMSLQYWLNKDYDKGLPKFVIWIILGIVLILVFVSIFAIMLRYTVKTKTKALYQRNVELIKAKVKAEKSEELKTIFLQNMSHEIRTPMNAIIGFLELIKDPDLDDQVQKKYNDIVYKSSKRLLSTINNILQISKINANELEVHYTQVNVEEIMEFHLDFFNKQAEDMNLELTLKSYVQGPKAKILTDRNFLNDIIANLINNAIKFTKLGGIEFGNYIEDEKLVFYIKDSGVGIPEDRLGAIFERFVQADLDITRPHEGSGLGLSIAKSYVNILNGQIWVDTKVAEGSTFYFSIPYTPVVNPTINQEVEESRETMPEKKLKILIAEDDNLSFLLLKQMLNNKFNTIVRAENGRKAVEYLQNNQDVSIILMDIKMPCLDGIGATKEIRKFNSTVPIIAQTAYALSGDKEKAIEAGCNEYLMKPINRNRLIKLVKNFT